METIKTNSYFIKDVKLEINISNLYKSDLVKIKDFLNQPNEIYQLNGINYKNKFHVYFNSNFLNFKIYLDYKDGVYMLSEEYPLSDILCQEFDIYYDGIFYQATELINEYDLIVDKFDLLPGYEVFSLCLVVKDFDDLITDVKKYQEFYLKYLNLIKN